MQNIKIHSKAFEIAKRGLALALLVLLIGNGVSQANDVLKAQEFLEIEWEEEAIEKGAKKNKKQFPAFTKMSSHGDGCFTTDTLLLGLWVNNISNGLHASWPANSLPERYLLYCCLRLDI